MKFGNVAFRAALLTIRVCPTMCPNAVEGQSIWQPTATSHLTLRLAPSLRVVAHLGRAQTLSVREISTLPIQLFLSDLQRFFQSPPSSIPPRNRLILAG